MPLETVIITLGAAIVKSALGIWLGSNKIAVDVSGAAVDTASKKLAGFRDQRRLARMTDMSAEAIADRLEGFIAGELPRLVENERIAAVEAVSETLLVVELADRDLFAVDLDAGHLDRYIRGSTAYVRERAALSEDGQALYDVVLRESCTYIIQYGSALPQSGIPGLAELLRRESELNQLVREALDRLPERRGEGDFERDYRQLVANRLDQVEFFGATLSDVTRRYPLSVAYLSLTTAEESQSGDDMITSNAGRRVPDALAPARRIFIRGDAGLGKTTLLQWIAVNSARRTFDGPLIEWNDTVPFFVALRRHADGELPAPEQFFSELGRHLSAEMQPGWVHQKLRTGEAIVLVDGVDELSEERRDEVRVWLHDLVHTFGDARYIVTSRPAAAPTSWLADGNFQVLNLEPMAPADTNEFVKRWHEAIKVQIRDAQEREQLDDYGARLLKELEAKSHLRRLARYPLLCALLCALHRDRHAHLPGNRMELYEVALHMLLERRETERGLAFMPALTRTAKTLLLQDIAYWLIRNGWTEAPTSRVIERIASALPKLRDLDLGAEAVYRYLLERTGLIREPVHQQVNFVHRTFQEYLAAKAAADADDIGILLDNADAAEWREVVVMAVGHSNPRQRSELVGGLLDKAERVPETRETLQLLAVACLETAPELPVDLRERIADVAAGLLPPKTVAAARALAAAGMMVLDILASSRARTAREVKATIRTIAEIGDVSGLKLIAKYATDRREVVRQEIRRSAYSFPPKDYAEQVLKYYVGEDGEFDIQNQSDVSLLKYLPNVRELHLQHGAPYVGREELQNLRVSRIVIDGAGAPIFRSYSRNTGMVFAVEAIPGRKRWWRADPEPAWAYVPGQLWRPDVPLVNGGSSYDLNSSHYIEILMLEWHSSGRLIGFPGLPTDADVAKAVSELLSQSSPRIGRRELCCYVKDLADPPYAQLAKVDHLTGIMILDSTMSDLPLLESHLHSLDFISVDSCPNLTLRLLSKLSGCTVAAFRGVTDFEPISRMPAIETILVLDESLPDLSPLQEARKLRNVVLPEVEDVGSLRDILPNATFTLNQRNLAAPREVLENGDDHLRYISHWSI